MLEADQTDLIAYVAASLRAMADESRIRILLVLKDGPRSVGALVQRLGIAQASVSKHLAVLKAAGLVDCTREGTQAIYRVSDAEVFDLCALVCGGVVRRLEAQQLLLANFRHVVPGT